MLAIYRFFCASLLPLRAKFQKYTDNTANKCQIIIDIIFTAYRLCGDKIDTLAHEEARPNNFSYAEMHQFPHEASMMFS